MTDQPPPPPPSPDSWPSPESPQASPAAPPTHYPGSTTSPTTAGSNGHGIAGLVLGICSFITPYLGIVVGIVGIVLSRKGLNRSKLEGAPYRRLAMAGFVLSIVGTSLHALVWILILVAGLSMGVGVGVGI